MIATTQVSDSPADNMRLLISALDAALAAHESLEAHRRSGIYADVTLCLMADEFPQAEYAFRLWCSAHNLTIKDRTDTYPEGHSIRAIETYAGDGVRRNRIARVQWRAVPAVAP